MLFFQQGPEQTDSLLFNKAYQVFVQNHLVEAESLLLAHFQLYPNSRYGARRLYLQGEIAFRRELYDRAIGYFDSLTKSQVDSSYCLLSTIRAGDAYFNLKDYVSALNRYKFAKEFHPDEETYRMIELKLHEVHFQLGDYKSLVEALHHFVDTNIDTTKTGGIIAKTMLRIARLYAENKEYHSALVLLERLLSVYPESPIMDEVLSEQVALYRLLGDYASYKKILMLLSTRKENTDLCRSAMITLARFYYDEQKYDSSLHYWVLLKEKAEYKAMGLFEIAKIYDRISREEEAIIVVQSLINECPGSRYVTEAYMLWISILKKQNDFEQALAVLQKLINKNPEDPRLLMELGKLYFEKRDYTMAVQSYLAASGAFRERRDESAQALILAGDAAYADVNKNDARQYYSNARLIAFSEEIKNLALKKLNRLE